MLFFIEVQVEKIDPLRIISVLWLYDAMWAMIAQGQTSWTAHFELSRTRPHLYGGM